MNRTPGDATRLMKPADRDLRRPGQRLPAPARSAGAQACEDRETGMKQRRRLAKRRNRQRLAAHARWLRKQPDQLSADTRQSSRLALC
jgi:hypothetical protein